MNNLIVFLIVHTLGIISTVQSQRPLGNLSTTYAGGTSSSSSSSSSLLYPSGNGVSGAENHHTNNNKLTSTLRGGGNGGNVGNGGGGGGGGINGGGSGYGKVSNINSLSGISYLLRTSTSSPHVEYFNSVIGDGNVGGGNSNNNHFNPDHIPPPGVLLGYDPPPGTPRELFRPRGRAKLNSAFNKLRLNITGSSPNGMGRLPTAMNGATDPHNMGVLGYRPASSSHYFANNDGQHDDPADAQNGGIGYKDPVRKIKEKFRNDVGFM